MKIQKKLGDYSRGIQNRNGLLFFFIIGCSFTPIMHSILTCIYFYSMKLMQNYTF